MPLGIGPNKLHTMNGTQATNVVKFDTNLEKIFNSKMLKEVYDDEDISSFGIQLSIPANANATKAYVEKLKFMPVVDAPLIEYDGTNYPDPSEVAEEKVEYTVYRKVAWIPFNDTLTHLNIKKALTTIPKRLGVQAKMTGQFDTVRGLCSSTNIVFANDRTTKVEVATSKARITESDLEGISVEFHNQLCGKITAQIASSNKNTSQSVDAAWIVLAAPEVISDLKALPGFVYARDYISTSGALKNEVGQIGEFRILRSSYTKKEDVGGQIVHTSVVFGAEAFASISFEKYGDIELIYIPANSKSKSDPANLAGSFAWKAYFGTKIINDAWLVNIFSTSTKTVGAKHYMDGGKLSKNR